MHEISISTMRKTILYALILCCTSASAETWTLNDCILHALHNNIQIQQKRITEQTGESTLKQNKSSLWPSLSFSTSHGFTYRPLQDDQTIRTVEGIVTTSSNNVTQSSTYGVSMNWTIWNGGISHKNVESQKIQNQMSALDTETAELTIQEQIARLYIQIMYCKEALKVNESLAATAQKQYERGQQMLLNGQMAKADLIRLEAQLANAKYDVVNMQTTVNDNKRQLKSLLELDINTDFDISGTIPEDEDVMSQIPSAQSVYSEALAIRPEIRSAELGIKSADMQLNIARRGYYPTVSMSASISNSHNSASMQDVGIQLKQNFNMGASLNVSVPLWDMRRTKTNIEKARYAQSTSQLNLQDQKNKLSSTIEQYWLTATSNQQKFAAAQTEVRAQEASYELVNEQFQNGLKNVVDLLQSRDNILSAEQTKLVTKYTTLLNRELLLFYAGGKMNL